MSGSRFPCLILSQELEALLAQKELQESRLKADLQAAAPVKLNFAVPSGELAHAKQGVSRASSNTSLNSADVLAKDRAEADAAWEEHVKVCPCVFSASIAFVTNVCL